MKQVDGFNGYYITEDGKLFSDKSGKLIEKKPFKGSSKYWVVDLYKDGKSHKVLLHRLVASHFVQNPDNKPIVDHKDGNINNVKASNLQWVTQKENIHKSYAQTGIGAVRNCRECSLYKDGDKIGEFKSVIEAVRYAAKQYNISEPMLYKHRIYKGFEVVLKV